MMCRAVAVAGSGDEGPDPDDITPMHSLQLGATGLATLAALSTTLSDADIARLAGPRRNAVSETRVRGWAHCTDEVMPGITCVAIPLIDSAHGSGALGILSYKPLDVEKTVAIMRDEVANL